MPSSELPEEGPIDTNHFVTDKSHPRLTPSLATNEQSTETAKSNTKLSKNNPNEQDMLTMKNRSQFQKVFVQFPLVIALLLVLLYPRDNPAIRSVSAQGTALTAPATSEPTQTAQPTATATERITPSDTPSPTATLSPTNSPTPTLIATLTSSPTFTSTPTVTSSPTNTPTATETATEKPTETPTVTPTETPTQTPIPPQKITFANAKELKQVARLGNGSVQQVSWSPDGKIFAMAGSTGLWVYDATNLSAQPIILGQDANYFNMIAFSPDSHRLVAATSSGIAQIWDLASDESQEIAVDNVSAATFSPSGTTIALGKYDGTIQLYDLAQDKAIATLNGHSKPVMTLNFNTDGTLLLSTSLDRTTRLWNVKTKSATITLTGTAATNSPHSALSPDGTKIISVTDQQTIIATDIKTNKTIKTFKPTRGYFITGLAINPDGKTIAALDSGREIELFDLNNGRVSLFAPSPNGELTNIAYSPDGTQIATINYNGQIVVRDAKSGDVQSTFAHSSGGAGLALSKDGTQILVGNLGDVQLLSTSTFEINGTVNGVVSRAVAFNPDATQFATIGFELRVWNTAGLALYQALGDQSDNTTAAAFSPDGKQLAAGSFDGTVRLWTVDTGDLVATFKGHSGAITAVAFSPDGSQLASASADRSIRLWNLATNKLASTLNGHSQTVTSIAYSPDGNKILSGGADGKLLLWTVKTGASTKQLTNLSGFQFTSVAFSPDGKLAAVGASNGDIYIVDQATSNEITSLHLHTQWVENVAFSPGGTTLYSTSVDGTLCVWAVQNSSTIP